MARLSIVMFPEPGHLLPTIRIATLVKAKGHTVTYLTIPGFSHLIERLGFHFRPILSHLVGPCHQQDPYNPHVPAAELWRRLAASIGVQGGSIRTLIRAAAPDTLVPQIAATSPDVLLCDSKIVFACGDLIRPLCPSGLIAVSTELPLAPNPPCPELVMCPKELEIPDQRRAEPDRHYCEPSMPPNVSDTRIAYGGNADRARLLLCSLGTQSGSYADAPTLFQRILDGFADDARWQVIIAAGSMANHQVFASLPSNIAVYGTIPQQRLLSAANVAILHGGLGGIKEAVMCRTPMVITPYVFDQHENAERVSHHGIGVTATGSESPGELHQMCEVLDRDSSVRGRLSTMATVFARMEALAPAARTVQQRLEAAS